MALVATFVFVPGAGAAPEQKTYTAVVNPDPVGAGQTIPFTLTIVNTTKTQQVGSANLSAPSSFSLISAVSPIPGGGTATIAGSTGGTVQLRDLAIPPGGARTVTFTAEVPCANGNYTWSIIAKQSNNFSGPPGNNFILTPPPASDLVTAVSGQCSLSWLTQPSHAKTNTAITNTPYDAAFAPPVGPFIKVEVRSAPYGGGTSTTRVAFSSDVVALSIGDDFSGPPPTTLTGTTSVPAVNGVATFEPGPIINQPGPNYTLLATNPIMVSGQSTAGESAPFNVSNAVCVAPCTTPETSAGGTRAQVTSNSQGGFVAASVGVGVQITCPSNPSPNQQVVAVFPLGVTETSTMLIETTFSLGIVTTPWSQVRACLASREPFTEADGTPADPVTIAGENLFIGVPPDCDNQTPVPPCFLPSLRNNQTDEITIRLLVPATDPYKK